METWALTIELDAVIIASEDTGECLLPNELLATGLTSTAQNPEQPEAWTRTTEEYIISDELVSSSDTAHNSSVQPDDASSEGPITDEYYYYYYSEGEMMDFHSNFAVASAPLHHHQHEVVDATTTISPRRNDVVLGKGGRKNHPGNVKFRDECNRLAPQYIETPTPQMKTEKAMELVGFVYDQGGLFLNDCGDNGEWHIVDFDTALKKAKQLLGDAKKNDDRATLTGKKRSRDAPVEDTSDTDDGREPPQTRPKKVSHAVSSGDHQTPIRRGVFEELTKRFQQSGAVVALVGPAGVGKSYLADIFTKHWLQQNPKQQRCRFWVRAATEASRRSSLIDILQQVSDDQVNADFKNVETKHIAAQVWCALARMPSNIEWIVVVDDIPPMVKDVEIPAELQNDGCFIDGDLDSIIDHPANCDNERGRILLTSRHDSCESAAPWGAAAVSRIKIGLLPAAASTSLLLESIPCRREETIHAAHELAVDHCQGLPLAIVTTAAAIRSSGITVTQYLEDVLSSKKTCSGGSNSKIDAILDYAIHHARSTGLGNVMDVVAWLNPDRIERHLLAADDAALEKMCNHKILNSIYCDKQGVSYCIHHLVQAAIRRSHCSPAAAIRALRATGFVKFSRHDRDTWSAAVQMLPHVDSIRLSIRESDVVQDSVGKVGCADLLCQGGHVAMWACCDFDTAQVNYEAALVLYTQAYALKGDDPTRVCIATAKKDLGRLHQALGDFPSARAMYRDVLGIMRRASIRDNAKASLMVATTLHNLGRVCLCLGERIEAEQYFHSALQMKLNLRASPASIALTMVDIGRIHQSFGRLHHALAQYKAIEAMNGFHYRSEFGATTRLCEGHVYHELGDLKTAKLKYEQALEVYDQVFGTKCKNDAVAMAHCHLGSVLIDIGDFDGAHLHLNTALEMMIFGPLTNHDNIANATYHFGRLYEKRGDHTMARTKYREAKRMLDDSVVSRQMKV